MSALAAIATGPLPERPLLAPWYRVATTPAGLALEYADALVVLEGAAAADVLPRLLPLLDGTRGLDEILALVPDARSARAALARLAEEGLLLEGPAATDAAAFHAAAAPQPLSPAAVADRLARARVVVAGEGVIADELRRLLGASGVGQVRRAAWTVAAGEDALLVAAPSPAELPRVAEWNGRRLADRREWLQVLPHNGRFVAIGPLYVPGETCCYECYRRRRARAIGSPPELEQLERVPAPYPVAPAVAVAAAALAATLALARLAAPESVAAGTLYPLELAADARVDGHRVFRVPRCPACGPAAARPAPFPWALELGR